MALMKGSRTGMDLRCDIQTCRFIVLDTELTGLNEKKDSIISIGAVRMCGSRVSLGDSYYRLINPESRLTAESVVIHEIPSEVSEKPDIRTVLSEFLSYCGNDVMVGFCASIDMEFRNREAKSILGHTIKNPVLDIFPMFEWVRRNKTARCGEEINMPLHYKLYDIAKYYGIEVNGAHNAIIV